MEPLFELFQRFMTSEINSAVSELKNIKKEESRKHLQRLVYVNLVNRFDTLIDNLILSYSIRDGSLKELALSNVREDSVSMRDFLDILSSEDPQRKVNKKIEDIVRLNILRQRHSKKLQTLLNHCFHCTEKDLKSPRVNIGDGRIHAIYAKRHKTTPTSIIGYADYLYSKRNGLVHGSSEDLKMLPSDAMYLEKNFGVATPKYLNIRLSAIETTSVFYSYLCKFMETGNWPDKRGF